MNAPYDVNDALRRRIEELERANRELRLQIRVQDRLSQATARVHESKDREHADEMSSATRRIETLQDSRSSLQASESRLRESEKRARSSEKKLRQIADNLPALIAYVDAEQRYRFNNKAYETWILRRPEDLFGLHVWDAIGDEAYGRAKPFIDVVLAGKRTWHEWWAHFPGGLRFVRSEYIPDLREDGSVAGFYVLVSDLTDIKRSQAALAESERRLRLAVDAGRMAIWETDSATDMIRSSPEMNHLLGLPPDCDPSAEDIVERYAPGEREKLRRVTLEALAHGDRHAETELEVVWPDGSRRWLLLRVEMRDIVNGIPGRTIGVAFDITARKRAEEHQQLLINELNHRVKNTLATVQSIVAQSLRNAATAAEAQDAVEGRLFALSRAHDVLTRENWDGASLREVVQQGIEPFQGLQDRFEVSGTDIRLPPRIALPLAMAFQELGTNAVKYGALSNEAGRIAVDWSVLDQDTGQHLRIVWREKGGPPVAPPARRGFGTRLIERSLAQELNGSVVIDFAPPGVVCTIDAPLTGS
ncbi:sensor histidine kinase [Microvirga pakistanensis]|uniref:sensor histidine kinase n=1 Tax=Microvirga pakistanensis TaxID=1682650 RepID=UPI00106B8EF0|nr:HWE histidine kinase domain-containing protein [Microvirga pakistanensis]